MFQPQEQMPSNCSAWGIQGDERKGATAWTGGWTQPVTAPPTLLLPSRAGFQITLCAKLIFSAGKEGIKFISYISVNTSRVKENVLRAFVSVKESTLNAYTYIYECVCVCVMYFLTVNSETMSCQHHSN